MTETETEAMPRFPADFAWGVATSAYQIEGAVTEDGRGESVWDVFCRKPGAIRDGQTGDVAVDHYHRWGTDVGLMAELGLTAYRFSIAWPRVQPHGKGPACEAGLDFYDRLTDGLLSRGITPVPTLFHWDLPQRLQEQDGGWLARDTAHRFAEYAALAAERLADRIPMWITLNEPFVVTAFGYALGMHAPGQELMLGALPTAHHQLLGHGLATSALRAAGARQVAITNNHSPAWAATDDPADVAAAQAYDVLHNRVFADPVLLGRYPDLSAFGIGPGGLDCVLDGDLAVISVPLDAYGVNYYSPTRLSALPDSPLPFRMEHITENGCSIADQVSGDGTVDDQFRIGYLDGHLRAVHAAMTAGVDVRGYFAWTLMDNFEWAEGYHQRFGLVHVDFETQRRTPKASFGWYRDLIAAQRQPSGA